LPLVAHHDKACTPQKHQTQKIKLKIQLGISKFFSYDVDDADDGDAELILCLSKKSPQVFKIIAKHVHYTNFFNDLKRFFKVSNYNYKYQVEKIILENCLYSTLLF
jgi:hypothetical protein